MRSLLGHVLAMQRRTLRGGFSSSSKIFLDSGVSILSQVGETQILATSQQGEIDVRQNMLNVIYRVFQNSAESASIFGVPESLLLSLWELLKAVSSSEFQDIDKFKENAR